MRWRKGTDIELSYKLNIPENKSVSRRQITHEGYKICDTIHGVKVIKILFL